jgi:hypothetical protein
MRGFTNSVGFSYRNLSFPSCAVQPSEWESDTTYDKYPYRAKIACSGALSIYEPHVKFDPDSEDYDLMGTVSEAGAGYVYIYAEDAPTSEINILGITLIPFA